MWRDSKKVIRERGGEFSTPTPMSTPPPAMAAAGAARSWRSAPCSPMQPLTMNNRSPEQRRQQWPEARPETFHIVHKVPAGDSPYVRAKQVQLIDRDPNRAISLFWSAINTGDRVDSALKDMAIVMKQLDRTEEAIEAIKSFRHLCSYQAQGSLDNVLIDLYKRAGRMEEHIELLHHKLKLLDEGAGFGGKRTKVARSQGKRFHVSIEQERSRLLGNLAWAYMQLNNYPAAEVYYREALSLEPDKNKQCNLAVCLMQRASIKEAKALLQAVKPSSRERELADSYIKSFDRASELLNEFESESILKPNNNKEMKTEAGRSFSSHININSKPKFSSINGDDEVLDRKSGDTLFFGNLPNTSAEKWKRESYFQNQFENGAKGTWVGSIFVEQGNGQWQTSRCHPPLVDKWEKESSSWQSSVQRRIDFKNRNWISKSGIEKEGCSASKNLKREGDNQFGCSAASLNRRNSEISWEHEDPSKKQPTMQSFLHHHQNLLKELHTPVENTGEVQSQNPAGVLEQASINQLWDGRSQITGNENIEENGTRSMGRTSTVNQDFSLFKNGKSWADIVEEEEEEFLHGCTNFDFDDDDDKWDNHGRQESSSASSQTPSKWVHGWSNGDFFYDENINSNIISSPPPHPPTSTPSSQSKLSSPAQHTQAQKSQMENLQQKLEFLDLKEEQCVKNSENYYYSVRNPSTRRALTFDQDEKETSESASCNVLSPLQKKALDFDDYGGVATLGSGGSACSKDSKVMRRGNRLKVFHDITTTIPDSPRSCGKDLKPPVSRGNRLKVFQDITLSPGSLKT